MRAAAVTRNFDASTTMRSAPHNGKPTCIYAAIALQCATADCKRYCICSQTNNRTLQNTLYEPITRQRCQSDPSRHPPHTRAALHRRRTAVYTKNTQYFALRHPPQHSPMHCVCIVAYASLCDVLLCDVL